MDTAPDSRERWILITVLLIAALARGLYVAERTQAPDFERPIVDAGYHDHWARELSNTMLSQGPQSVDPGFRERAYLRPPGYPHFLALVYGLSAGSTLTGLLLQSLLGLASAFLGYLIARRYFGGQAGLAAAALLGLYWVLVYFEGELHAPALLVFLCLALVALLGRWVERPRLSLALAAGITLGLAASVRPNVLAFLPLILLWGWWVRRAQPSARAAWPSAVAGVLACLAAIAPWTVRNALVAGEFVPISSNAGINLWIGNHAQATGFVAEELPGLGPFATCYDYPNLVARLEGQLGQELTDSQVSSWFSAQALAWISANPGQAARLTWKKARYFWGPIEVFHNKELRVEREHSAILALLPGGFAGLLALACLGVIAALRGRRSSQGAEQNLAWAMTTLLLGLTFTYFLSVLPFFQAARYRVPALPFLMLLGAQAFPGLLRLLRDRRWSSAAIGVGSWSLLTLILYLPAIGDQPRRDKWQRDRAHSFELAGEGPRAMQAYRAALEAAPEDADSHYNLGRLLEQSGQPDSALEEYRQAVRLKPTFARAHNNLGILLARAGQVLEAIPHFEAAVLHDPTYPLGLRNLGSCYHALQRRPEAIATYQRWEELQPEVAAVYEALARAQGEMQDFDAALATVTRGLQRVPANDAAGRQQLEAAAQAYRAQRMR